MGLIAFFTGASAREYAVGLAEELSKTLPPKLVDGSSKVLSVNKVTKILEGLYAKASEYRVNSKIGFMRQAMFANTFRWQLTELGYPEAFVKMATEGLVLAMTKVRELK
ncbi:hypothetical protein HNP46_002270 [Pseudomonas nitritireducens]|uniref:Uncharacterized protein n=1 Tax=Pseudomonas nitroreducens TaxID=46680 RepID=A0A7W7P045_PSENT|nr:hypothetical protein [Pseudomonas nitritireducens]MBB4863423.1 hypothetical protein [Pseudomonas nitritireducens]